MFPQTPQFLSLLENGNYLPIENLKQWVSDNEANYKEALPHTLYNCEKCKQNENNEDYGPPCVLDETHPCTRNEHLVEVYFCMLYDDATHLLEIYQYEEICKQALIEYQTLKSHKTKLKAWTNNVNENIISKLGGSYMYDNRFKYDDNNKITAITFYNSNLVNNEDQIFIEKKYFENLIALYELLK